MLHWMSTFATTPSGNGLLNNLVSYYKCDTSGSFPDAHGSNPGTINGATFTASGKINGAYDYTTNDYVSIDGQDDTPTVITISSWAKKTAGATNSVIYGHRSAATNLLQLNIATDTRLDFQMRDSSGTLITLQDTGFVSGNFNHIVAIMDSVNDSHRLYVNGVLKDSSTHNFTGNFTATKTTIGASNSGSYMNFFEGTIDEVGVWNTALTQEEITDLYNSGAGLSYDNFTT